MSFVGAWAGPRDPPSRRARLAASAFSAAAFAACAIGPAAIPGTIGNASPPPSVGVRRAFSAARAMASAGAYAAAGDVATRSVASTARGSGPGPPPEWAGSDGAAETSTGGGSRPAPGPAATTRPKASTAARRAALVSSPSHRTTHRTSSAAAAASSSRSRRKNGDSSNAAATASATASACAPLSSDRVVAEACPTPHTPHPRSNPTARVRRTRRSASGESAGAQASGFAGSSAASDDAGRASSFPSVVRRRFLTLARTSRPSRPSSPRAAVPIQVGERSISSALHALHCRVTSANAVASCTVGASPAFRVVAVSASCGMATTTSAQRSAFSRNAFAAALLRGPSKVNGRSAATITSGPS